MVKVKAMGCLVLGVLACSCQQTQSLPPQKGKNTREDVVASLQETGVDTKSPVQFELYLKFKSQSDAEAAANELRSHCQSVETYPEPVEKTWVCKGRKLLVPDSDETEYVLYRAKESASAHHGEFEAWEINFGR